MPRIPIAFHSYLHRHPPVSPQRIINWHPQRQPRDAKAPVILMPTPGLIRFTTTSNAVTRGLHVMGSALYAVIGAKMFMVSVEGVVTTLGDITLGGPVRMADNNVGQLVVVVPESGEAWVVTSSTLTKITDPDFPLVIDVTFLDGVHIFVRQDTQRFIISAINDATAYDALDFAAAEASPDNLLACRRVGQDIWLIGERTIEVWEGSGAADFPFARKYGGVIPLGTVAAASVAIRETTAFLLAQNRVIYMIEGARPAPISTPAIDQAIAGYAVVSDAWGWVYDQEGHQFYVLTFPSEGATWVYDVVTQAWHERESEDYGGRWRCSVGVSFAGAVIVGDAADGYLYVLSPTAYTEDGTTIVRVAIGAPQHGEGKRLFVSRFELDCATGVGLQNGQGSDPKVWLQWSDDGGRTWSTERWADLGTVGQYTKRVVWQRLGSAFNRSFRIGMSDPVGTALIAANVDVTMGAW